MGMEHLGVVCEVWPVAADEVGVWLCSGGDAWRSDRVGSDSEPHWEAEGLLRPLRLRPALLHSTSWRMDGARLVVTYVAVLETPGLVRDAWPDAEPIPADLLREAGGPSPHGAAEVPVPRHLDVLYHALRHLRFLSDTDASARAALSGWWPHHLAAMRSSLAGMYEHAAG